MARAGYLGGVNLLLLEPDEIVDGRATVRGRRGRHLATVLRVAPGRRVRAGVIGGRLGEAEVLEVAGDAVSVRVELTSAPPAPLDVSLILAVPRPKVLSRLVQHAASWGLRRIDLVNAWRVDKSYFGSSRLSAAELADDLRLGAEQGMTTVLPEIAVHPLLVPFLDDVLPAIAPPAARRLFADARAGVDLEAAAPPGDVGPVVLAIGPEGGWIDRERASFLARGFTSVRLGAAILRTEAAVTAALAQLALLRRL